MADETIDNREKERVMRTRMKVVCWSTVALMAMVWTGCCKNGKTNEIQVMTPDAANNEVVQHLKYYRYKEETPFTPFQSVYVEKVDASRKEICFLNVMFLAQAYTIEGDTIANYRWFSGTNWDYGREYEYRLLWYWLVRTLHPSTNANTSYEERLVAMQVAEQQAPEVQSNATTTTVIHADYTFNLMGPTRTSSLELLKWSGETSKTLGVVTSFCKAITADVGKPEHMYPSYLRAIPLYTEEEREQAKDIPLIKLSLDFFFYEGVDYHVAFDVRAPYMLIPVPEKGSPFSSLNKPYEPGRDKVRVKCSYEGSPDIYFLVESFKGEGWKD